MDEVKTQVVNVKHGQYDVYIGRGGPWGNQFVIGKDGNREQVIARYRRQLWDDVATCRVSVSALAALHGKRLGCYCAPQACHGDVLARAAAWAAAQVEARS